MGQCRESSVARHERSRRSEAAARTDAGDHDAGRVDAQLFGVLGQPAQARITILDRGGVRMLGSQPVVHRGDHHTDLVHIG